MSDPTDPTSLGNIARIFSEDVTGVHVARAVEHQKQNPSLRIGEALVETGALSERERDALLRKQEDIRSGKHTRKDVMQMMDYATKKTRAAPDVLQSLIKMLKRSLGR